MPQTRSMKKRLRQSLKRRYRNVGRKRAIKAAVRETLDAAGSAGEGGAADALRQAFKALDKAAVRGVIHRNAAARRKSRLVKRLGG